MTDPPATTEQDKGEWIVVGNRGISDDGDPATYKLVCVVHSKGGELDEDIEFAMRDPARVLNVVAFPKVVEALEDAAKALDKTAAYVDEQTSHTGTAQAIRYDAKAARAALALAHRSAAGAGT